MEFMATLLRLFICIIFGPYKWYVMGTVALICLIGIVARTGWLKALFVVLLVVLIWFFIIPVFLATH